MTQTINLKVYSQLVAEVTPKIIETEAEYEQFLAVAERLTFKQDQTPEESALYDLVTMLVETYEAQHYTIDESSPAEILLHIIESSGINRTDLVEIFSSSDTLTQVLAGQKPINTVQAQALAERFKLSPQLFLTR
ncbi:transcriptional regulator [Chamaesiphon sp. VAR_48_metabat_135_sub]|uniref:helix-turn-helix domain-containing protein n=1 Tax=Chamaesiphon sp. VAR_48_metabat_135_sub TaxID=2964699 RepID=UPI00286D5943|nr:transcriptional regulator [Chamaesiphon sp. VAR_48_metabat_135_sub]